MKREITQTECLERAEKLAAQILFDDRRPRALGCQICPVKMRWVHTHAPAENRFTEHTAMLEAVRQISEMYQVVQHLSEWETNQRETERQQYEYIMNFNSTLRYND